MAREENNIFNNVFYDNINQMYIANYQCLQVLNEDSPFDDKSEKNMYRAYFEPEEGKLFGENGAFIKNWQSAKFDAFRRIREQLICDIEKAINDCDDTQKFFEEKDKLLQTYNELYGENRSFEEVFRGYEVIDDKFGKDIVAETRGEDISVDVEKYGELCNLYVQYIYDYQAMQGFETFTDIYRALYDDLNPSGYRSIFFGNPENPKVKVLNYKFFTSMYEIVEKLYLNCAKDIASLEKLAIKTSKTKNFDSDEALQMQFYEKFVELQKNRRDFTLIDGVYFWLDAIYLRFQSANSVNIEFTSQLVDKSVYLFTGNGLGGKNQLAINDIYIHQNEIDYVITMLKNIKEAKPLLDKIYEQYGKPSYLNEEQQKI